MTDSNEKSRDIRFPHFRIAGLLLAFILAIAATGLAGVAFGRDDAHVGTDVVIEGDLTDMQFAAGRNVTIRADIADDVFAVGREVWLDGGSARNAIIAGLETTQRRGRLTDLIALANEVEIGGTIMEDVIAVGRTVRVVSGASIGGNARIAAETVRFEGKTGAGLQVIGRRVVINGVIDGKVDLLAAQIVVGPDAVIRGDLVYRSESPPEIAAEATIDGDIREITVDLPDLRSLIWTLIGIGIALLLMWVLAGLVVTAFVAALFPAMVLAASERLGRQPWSNLGIGVAVLVMSTLVGGAAYGSIVGIPIGGLISLLVMLLILFGLVTAGSRIGLFIRDRTGRGTASPGLAGMIGWTLLGVVVIGFVALIPVIGLVVSGLSVAAGAGASARELWVRLRAA